MSNSTRVKVCGLTNLADALLALEYGADRLGFIGVPDTPRFITPVQFGAIVAALPSGTQAVLVVRDIADAQEYRATRVQYYVDKGNGWPLADAGVERIPVVRPRSVDETRALIAGLSPLASAVLVDAHHPSSLGGTGITGDWDAAAEAVRISPVPVYLAGGLNPENVGTAIAAVHPYGVDVSSGVEARPGAKDAAKLRAFIAAVRSCSE